MTRNSSNIEHIIKKEEKRIKARDNKQLLVAYFNEITKNIKEYCYDGRANS